MLVQRGTTGNFVVSYDDSLTNGPALADAVLGQCEQDLASISGLFGGIMPPATSLPFHVDLMPGTGGGASHPGCADTHITATIGPNVDAIGVPLAVAAEVVEVFEAVQGLGLNCGASNGEALSRVLPGVLYPANRLRFMVGTSWLNSPRADWVTNTEPTDQDFVSIGCGTLFYYYLADQLGFAWKDIVAASAPTLAQTAAQLGLQNAFTDFTALLARHYPPGAVAYLTDDDPFPLPDPILYLRHNLADDGTSHTGTLAVSPDIIVRNGQVTSPQATFSTPASIASDAESDPTVLGGQTNYLYLRVWNRGKDATNVTGTVYWSPPATLVSPNLWNLIGSSTFADVPPNRVVQISDPGIAWSSIPAPGHYCFVATVGNAEDPGPQPGSFASFPDFVRYVYAHNDLTWRNFNVVQPFTHKHIGKYAALEVLIAGAWDESRRFDLEILAELPEGSDLALRVPLWLAVRLKEAGDVEFEITDEDNDETPVDFPLRPSGHQSFHGVELPAERHADSHLLVFLRDEENAHGRLTIRQLFEGLEVGRITWNLVPGSSREAHGVTA